MHKAESREPYNDCIKALSLSNSSVWVEVVDSSIQKWLWQSLELSIHFRIIYIENNFGCLGNYHNKEWWLTHFVSFHNYLINWSLFVMFAVQKLLSHFCYTVGIIWKKKHLRKTISSQQSFTHADKCTPSADSFTVTLFSGILYPWVAFVQGLVVPTLDIPIHRINNYPMQRYSVWSTARNRRIASVWAKMSSSNPCPGSFWRTSNCVSKEKEIEKCNFSSCKIFLKQYFGLNFRRLKVKQEPKSKEYDVHKRRNFPRLPGPSLYECIKG